MLLWHEHTWGAAASISEPDRPDVVAQWEYKRAFAVEADRLSRELFDEAAGRRAAPSAGSGVGIANTLARPRGGLVVLPADRSRAGERVSDLGGPRPAEPAARRRLARGRGARGAGAGPLDAERHRGSAGAPDRARYGLGHDARERGPPRRAGPGDGRHPQPASTAPAGTELAGPQGLARYRYVPGRDPALAQDAGPVTITVEEPGPLVAVLRAEGQAPGAQERRYSATASSPARTVSRSSSFSTSSRSARRRAPT